MNYIGMDFDDTLIDMRKSMVQLLNKKHNKDLNYAEIEKYEVSDLYGYSFEEFIDFFTKNQRVLHTIQPYPFLSEVLFKMSNNSKLFIMTGRPEEWIESATNWVVEHKLPVEKIICASQYSNGKAECALNHNINLFIEDNPSHALSIADSGIDVLLIDKPYNLDCKHKHITRVKNWKEIGDLLFN